MLDIGSIAMLAQLAGVFLLGVMLAIFGLAETGRRTGLKAAERARAVATATKAKARGR